MCSVIYQGHVERQYSSFLPTLQIQMQKFQNSKYLTRIEDRYEIIEV